MSNYVLNRDHTLRTVNGVISFKKGEPTWVVPHMERDAKAIGAECVEGEGVKLLEDEPKLPVIPQGGEREQQIFIAFDMLIERNESTDFTGQGVPTVKAIESIVGFDADRAEINEYWALYKERKAEQ
jgi:hypothetical protein